MQRFAANRSTKILRLGLFASLVVCSAMVTVPKAHCQQDVDPTWYDSQPAANNAAQHPSSRPKQGKSGSNKREHSSNKAHAKRQGHSNQTVANASVK